MESSIGGGSEETGGKSAKAPKVHHIPIHVESRPGNNLQNQKNQPQDRIPKQDARIMETENGEFDESPRHNDSPDRIQALYTPSAREGNSNTHHIASLPQFRERAFSERLPSVRGFQIPVQVERSDSSPTIGNDPSARRRSPEKVPEPNVATGTFPRAKNQEAPLKWAQSFFKGPKPAGSLSSEQPQEKPVEEPTLNVVSFSPEEKIGKVLLDLKDLKCQVDAFQGHDAKSKEYRYLDEMLTRLMLSLDDVIIEGNESIRAARRNAIKTVQEVIDKLEQKVQRTGSEVHVEKANNSSQLDPQFAQSESKETADHNNKSANSDNVSETVVKGLTGISVTVNGVQVPTSSDINDTQMESKLAPRIEQAEVSSAKGDAVN